MNIFVNDYNDLCHEKVWQALENIKKEANPGYGFDKHCDEARRIIQEKTKGDPDVFFLPGGTITNILGLTANLRPYEAIVTPDTGHIHRHEVGAPEAFGHKLITVPQQDGKITVEGLKEVLKDYGSFYNVLPGILYISNTTELGTIYTYEEMKALYEYAKEIGIYMYIDGARMACAMVAANIKWNQFPEICDAFSLGGTKDGALFGEALIFFNKEMSKNFTFYMKQHGALMAKGFLLGVQYKALLEGEEGKELYLENARIANHMAKLFAKKWKEIGGTFYSTPVSNQIFILIKKTWLEHLEKDNMFEIEDEDVNQEEMAIRLVMTYRTTEEELNSFISQVKNLM
ncbi:MAG: beta-eliminating lyase-related protein [Tissierellia bacterium]|nr:beta-eliminating lyase-related protein [Tissierellia bacterium]